MRAKTVPGGAEEQAACHALPVCKQREAHILFAAGAEVGEWSQSGQAGNPASALARSLPAPSLLPVSLGTPCQFILVTICEEQIITPLAVCLFRL